MRTSSSSHSERHITHTHTHTHTHIYIHTHPTRYLHQSRTQDRQDEARLVSSTGRGGVSDRSETWPHLRSSPDKSPRSCRLRARLMKQVTFIVHRAGLCPHRLSRIRSRPGRHVMPNCNCRRCRRCRLAPPAQAPPDFGSHGSHGSLGCPAPDDPG